MTVRKDHALRGDMTVGSPLKKILWFAVPLFIGNIFQQVYNLAGSRAEAKVDAPGSFQVAFIDELYKATPEDIAANPFEIEEA